jgi:hypothetical protein
MSNREGEKMGALLKGALGLVFLAVGIWAVITFSGELLVLVRGCLGLFLILVGIITLAIAKD